MTEPGGSWRSRLPRGREGWRAALRDAWSFGEGVNPPVVFGPDLLHRAVVLVVVAAITGLFVALLALPGTALFGRSVNAVVKRFDVPIPEAEIPRIAQRSVIVDRSGRIVATLAGEENRIFVPLSAVPQVTRDAILAVEDANFYEHNGVDLPGLVRATLLNFRSGGVRQGGSTITQQLVKNTIVGSERSIERKIREAKLAVELEDRMTKNEILEVYLNEVYLGEGRYGIGTAAEYYFGKSVKELTLAESALLAGLIKAPEDYEPLSNPEAARARRRLALVRMLDEGMITRAQFANADAKPLGAKAHPLPEAKSPYFVEYVKAQILDDPRFGETRQERARALFQAGLRIETTLDNRLQRAAQRANENVLNLKGDPASALVSIEPETGAVVAMVGGRDFEDQKFNLAVQGARQPGSTFKPLTMVAALEAGIPPSFTLNTPSPLRVYDPGQEKYIKVRNYDDRGRGFIDMREATAFSVNTYYMQLIEEVGPAAVADVGERMGITTELPAIKSLALGTVAVSPFEMASAYATLANNGVRCTPFGITRVTDSQGRTIVANTPDCERTIPGEVAAQATDILRGVIEYGTGAANGDIGRPAAGKTGTTDFYTDSWFAGYTPQFATVVWLGFPESTERSLYNIHGLPQVFGGSLPAMIWNRYMTAAHEGLPVEGFPTPPTVEKTGIPNVVGMTFAEAKDRLERAGFTVRKEVVASSEPEGTVVAQDPAGGTKAPPGRLVVLRVSDGSVDPDPSPEPEPSESPQPSPTPTDEPACDDGVDNDEDGKTDHPDDDGCDGPNDDDEGG